MTKNPDPNSIRSIRRKKRNFKGSRPERRAKRRLEDNKKIFEVMKRIDATPGTFTEPGATEHW